MPFPQTPTDLYVVNGWYLEGMPGLVSPHFEALEGIQNTTNKVEIVDAGSNIKYKFGAQIQDFGELTLTRTYQGTLDDITLEAIVQQMIGQGLKLPISAVKLHHLNEVMRIVFNGFNIQGVTYPTWDVNGEDKFLVSYQATCDGYLIIR